MSQIVEHTEIDEHLEEIAENLIVEHLIYTVSSCSSQSTLCCRYITISIHAIFY